MTEPLKEAMVSVPVKLIEAYLRSSDAERWPQMANQLRECLPPHHYVVIDTIELDEARSGDDIKLGEYLNSLDGLPDVRALVAFAADDYFKGVREGRTDMEQRVLKRLGVPKDA